MAHKKAAGRTRNGRDSVSKRLGLKRSDGQMAKPGAIIVRQRGTRIRAGMNVAMGKDHTLFAKHAGTVKFVKRDNKTYAVVIVSE
jgi:large subunit ribosomal protein L27